MRCWHRACCLRRAACKCNNSLEQGGRWPIQKCWWKGNFFFVAENRRILPRRTFQTNSRFPNSYLTFYPIKKQTGINFYPNDKLENEILVNSLFSCRDHATKLLTQLHRQELDSTEFFPCTYWLLSTFLVTRYSLLVWHHFWKEIN